MDTRWTGQQQQQNQQQTNDYLLCIISPYNGDIIWGYDRLYLPGRNGAKGFLQVIQTVKEEKHALADYVKAEKKNQCKLKTGTY